MQLPTHFVTGVFIDSLVKRSPLPQLLKPLVVAVSCYLSHGVLDKLARATYHPPDPIDDTFWKTYHHQVLPTITYSVLGTYAPKHLFAMVCAALPDLDWVVRGLKRRFGWRLSFWDHPILNESLHKFWDQIPVVNQLNRLPDLRFERRGVLVELGLVAILFGLIHILGSTKNH
jgi:hypothetical protein